MNDQTIEMNIAGMHCGSCAIGIQMLTAGLDGVKASEVSYDTKKAKFTYDADKISLDGIKEQIKTLGYTAE
ncbi:MAG: heavy metal-associated domain-containing protein [Chitinophagaceae bacterium]